MKRIFAVDDSAVIRLYIEESLKEKGYDVVCAKNGKKAMEKILDLTSSIDVFIIDIIMAEMDGLTLIQKIRELELYENTPIIVLTSMHDKTTIEEAKSAGANCWVNKPFEIEQIFTILDRLL